MPMTHDQIERKFRQHGNEIVAIYDLLAEHSAALTEIKATLTEHSTMLAEHGHLTAALTGKLAAAAGVGRLVVSHLLGYDDAESFEAARAAAGTVPVTAAHAGLIVPVRAAIALVRDMGGNALKYFPMQGLKREDEYRAVVRACAEERFALEPTGGIDPDNFEAIVRIALEAGVPQVIPHIYSSIVDPATGDTVAEQVRMLHEMLAALADRYA